MHDNLSNKYIHYKLFLIPVSVSEKIAFREKDEIFKNTIARVSCIQNPICAILN